MECPRRQHDESEPGFRWRELIELRPQFVALLAGRIEIEHQVLDVEPQLRESFLNECQEPAATMNAVDHLDVGRFHILGQFRGQFRDGFPEVKDFAGKLGSSGGRELFGSNHVAIKKRGRNPLQPDSALHLVRKQLAVGTFDDAIL
jgi:hypothetical protein